MSGNVSDRVSYRGIVIELDFHETEGGLAHGGNDIRICQCVHYRGFVFDTILFRLGCFILFNQSVDINNRNSAFGNSRDKVYGRGYVSARNVSVTNQGRCGGRIFGNNGDFLAIDFVEVEGCQDLGQRLTGRILT